MSEKILEFMDQHLIYHLFFLADKMMDFAKDPASGQILAFSHKIDGVDFAAISGEEYSLMSGQVYQNQLIGIGRHSSFSAGKRQNFVKEGYFTLKKNQPILNGFGRNIFSNYTGRFYYEIGWFKDAELHGYGKKVLQDKKAYEGLFEFG